jgi:hypothetical protein
MQMRTAMFIAFGVVLMGLFLGVGKAFFREKLWFIFASSCVIWVAIAATNMWVGVVQAGYSVMEELPIFVVISAVPVIVGYFALRVLRGRLA